ncbi:MAG: endolytic transglycosylase MltG [Oscillospiraceae bacterium]|nr:endolytic transglycosylase MltG [Oscillospiraceae bacterium]
MSDMLEDLLEEYRKRKEIESGAGEPAGADNRAFPQTAEADAVPAREAFRVDPLTAARVEEERRRKVSSFQVNLDIDGQFSDPPEPPVPAAAPDRTVTDRPAADRPAFVLNPFWEDEQPDSIPGSPADRRWTGAGEADYPPEDTVPPAEEDVLIPEDGEEEPKRVRFRRRKKRDPRAKTAWGCFRGMLYAVIVLGASLTLAIVLILAGIDMTGLNKSDMKAEVIIPKGAAVGEIAQRLEKAGLIDYPIFFSLYAKFKKADYMPGTYTELSPDMGYSTLIEKLRQGVPRETVRVTIPEGYTVNEIADLLNRNEVCTPDVFYQALQEGDYSEYAFVNQIQSGDEKAKRTFALEGYLFPNTYEFYTQSSGETVIRKLLDGFGDKFDTKMRARVKASGMTIDDVIILASIVEKEAGYDEDYIGEWDKVGRVLLNRLAPDSKYPKLECDSTYTYFTFEPEEPDNPGDPKRPKKLDLSRIPDTITVDDYNTYNFEGLPPGAICNPGLDAINGVLSPSEDSAFKKYYFFVSYAETGEESTVIRTKYFETFKEHDDFCRAKGIGIYRK